MISATRPEPDRLVPPAPAESMSDEAEPIMHTAAWEKSGTRGAIVQVGGVLDKPAEAVKQGVAKVADAITPTPSVVAADDPTLLSTKPKPTPELYLSIAEHQEQMGKPAMAEQSYQQALRMAPKHLGAHLAYARYQQRQGRPEQALHWYQKAAKLHPREAAVYNDMGLLYARHGDGDEAIAAYRRAIEMQPKRALYRNNMAVLLVDLGQPDQAMAHLRAVYSEAEACYKLGYLLQQKGQTHQAVEAFSKAAALNPSMKEARAWLEYLRADFSGGPRVARKRPGVPDDLDPPEGRRGEVRQLPPVLKPLPQPAQEAPPVPGAGPGPRRLPPTSAERRTAYDEGVGANDLPDAPLPPSPRGRVTP